MGKEETLKTMLQAVINYVRNNYSDNIDKAYAYFWDETSPEDYLQGTSLALGFANFEDWFIFDCKLNDSKETFMELYIRNNKDLKKEETALIEKIKDSVLSIYEVVSVSKDKKITLKDLLLGGDHILRDKRLTKGLKKGDMFATRLLSLDGKHIMGGCVYPFRADDKKKLQRYIDRQFSRYKRNVMPDGTMRRFLKDYGDVINIAWMNLILNQAMET